MKKNDAPLSQGEKVVSLDLVKGVRYNAEEEKEENTIGRQIEAARERLGLSRSDLRGLVSNYGVTSHRDIVRRWEIGETIPTAYQLIALCHALNLDEGFAYFGGLAHQLNEVGQKKLLDYKNDLIATGLYSPESQEIEYIDMPVSYLPASAGTGSILDEDNCEWISVPKTSVPAGADRGIRVSGDSMEPVYNDGQLVWVQFTKELRPGEEGIFMLDDKGYIKAFSLQTPDETCKEAFTDIDGVLRPQPVLKSYNKKYDPIVITPDVRFEIVGRVLR